MSRGHGVRQVQALAFLERLARVGVWLGDDDSDVWAPVIDIAGEGASRADIESVRRAVRQLAADGLVELRYQLPADKFAPQHYQLAARLSVESPYARTKAQHLEPLGPPWA